MGIRIGIGSLKIGQSNAGSGFDFVHYWSILISATVETAAPTHVVLTFPAAASTVAADITATVNGVARAVSSASWTGAVWTVVLASAVVAGDVVVMTFVPSGGTTAVTNNVWSDYVAPVAWDWALPLTIQKNSSNVFRVDPTFDLEAYANIAVTKTYYLNTVSGNDGNTGLTAALPKKTWNHIIGLADADEIIIQDGSYLIRAESSLAPSRNTKVIGEGTVYFTSQRALGAWSLTVDQTKTYQANVAGGEYIARVIDEGTLNALGNPTPYIERASIALVEANAGSYYWAGGVIYIHSLTGADPTGRTDLRFYDSSAIYWSRNIITYFENIDFRGGFTIRNASDAVAAKCYTKNCVFHKALFVGIAEVINQSDVAKNTNDDAFNYAALNGIETKAIEIDCDLGEGGLGTTNQASTIHDSSRIVRVNGKYHDMRGQCIADVAVNSMAICLGSEAYNSGSGVGFYTSGKQWLDTCHSHDNALFDIENTLGGTTYTRNCTLEKGVNLIEGTLTPY